MIEVQVDTEYEEEHYRFAVGHFIRISVCFVEVFVIHESSLIKISTSAEKIMVKEIVAA